VRDIDTLRKTITGDVVINLAAVHRDDVSDHSEYQNTNVNGAKNLALICSEKGIKKIIFTSTVAVYSFAEKAQMRMRQSILLMNMVKLSF